MRLDTSQRATIERELRIAAAPEVVFTYLIDPARLVTWMGSVATLDPRPGGVFRLDYHGQWVSSGEFIEVDPPRRVVFTWGWEMQGDPTPPGSSRVEFSLQADNDGTLLRLVHRGLPSEAVGPHTDGWDHFLPGLATATGAHAAVSNAEEA
ncbi:MAG: SRPBCC domain-containing protein, partial [Chloroflexi bacterium]